jgi:hypothetical protein
LRTFAPHALIVFDTVACISCARSACRLKAAAAARGGGQAQ